MSKIGAYVLETCADNEDWPEPDIPETWTSEQDEQEILIELFEVMK